MEQPTIHTLVMMIRGFNNAVTVKGLAAQLDISYSTLARCKNGVWPRAITFDAMRGALYDCRERFFGNDDDAIEQSMVRYLRLNNIETSTLEAIYAREGFESFVTELLQWASQPETYCVRSTDSDEQDDPEEVTVEFSEPDPADMKELEHASNADKVVMSNDVGSSAPAFKPTSPAEDMSRELAVEWNTGAGNLTNSLPIGSVWRSVNRSTTVLYSMIPISLILLLGLFGVPVGQLLSWAASHRPAFLGISLGIALFPLATAFLVDAPLAWHEYKHTHPNVEFSFYSFALVAKYGDTNEVIPGKGRVSIFWPRCSYQTLCNVLGALIYISLLVFLESLPGFDAFLTSHQWSEFYKVGIVVAFLVSFEQLRGCVMQPRPATCDTLIENPDNYLPTRAHVWANTMHLAWSISLSCTLLLCLITYSINNFRMMEAPLFMLLPIYCGMLFFAQAYASPYAIEAQCTDGGAFVPCVIASSVGFIALLVTCYLPSWQGLVLCMACLASVIWAFLWQDKIMRTENASWLEQGKHASSYSVYFVIALAGMLVIGILTSAFI
ncbi:MAG: hypothetical protein Q4B54_01805 [Coriobacteriales bacterium]|nr:hypothetical protein [Coriobacteriales bacterium]